MSPLQMIKNQFLESQRILRFFEQGRNMALYQSLEPETRAKVDGLIIALKYDEIKKELNDTLELSQRSLGYLRKVAQSLGVPKYSSISRRALVDAIVSRSNNETNKNSRQANFG